MISASVACLTIICKYDFVSFINSLMIQGMQSLAWRDLVVMANEAGSEFWTGFNLFALSIDYNIN